MSYYSLFHFFCSGRFPLISERILHKESSFSHRFQLIKKSFQVLMCLAMIRHSILTTNESVECLWGLPLRRYTRSTATDNDVPRQAHCHADLARALLLTSQTSDCRRRAAAVVAQQYWSRVLEQKGRREVDTPPCWRQLTMLTGTSSQGKSNVSSLHKNRRSHILTCW